MFCLIIIEEEEMMSCCRVDNCVGKGSVFWGYGAALWGDHILMF